MKAYLSLSETKELFLWVADRMIASQDQLSEADRLIGDGDHGVGMARGFEAVSEKLISEEPTNLCDIFTWTGMAMITTIGGAAGVIFGTWFVGGGKGLAGKNVFDSRAFQDFMQAGLQAVQARGKARAGEKTMVDVLIPVCAALEGSEQKPLQAVLEIAAQAAAQGVENTKKMVATIGKAKTLGERSLGHPDPGAISANLIISFMSKYVMEKEG